MRLVSRKNIAADRECFIKQCIADAMLIHGFVEQMRMGDWHALGDIYDVSRKIAGTADMFSLQAVALVAMRISQFVKAFPVEADEHDLDPLESLAIAFEDLVCRIARGEKAAETSRTSLARPKVQESLFLFR